MLKGPTHNAGALLFWGARDPLIDPSRRRPDRARKTVEPARATHVAPRSQCALRRVYGALKGVDTGSKCCYQSKRYGA